ncbi:hypothetical protein BBJ28_00026428 [Nothophytophthora sp. Chile5]|nr:hypothetical protein BBJ28_00026428 [Nothophytophthora sp. Chile5]
MQDTAADSPLRPDQPESERVREAVRTIISGLSHRRHGHVHGTVKGPTATATTVASVPAIVVTLVGRGFDVGHAKEVHLLERLLLKLGHLIQTNDAAIFNPSFQLAVCYQFDFYQYFLRAVDRDVEQLLKSFTFREVEETRDIVAEHEMAPEKREVQKLLAEGITVMMHGQEGLRTALDATELLFGKKSGPLTAEDDAPHGW